MLHVASEGANPSGRFICGIRASKRLVASLGLPLILYVILRPENYGLTPNSLDPVFYTGYSINFDDILNAVGDRHYFVSRWTAYYPMYIFSKLFGPLSGRLLWRLALASMILCLLWSLGRRLGWRRSQQCLVGVLVLTMPIFVRAFFTDYVEYSVVGFGLCLACLCIREKQTLVTAAAAGVLGASMIIANPISIKEVAISMLVALVFSASQVWNRLMFVGVTAATGVATIIGGLVMFRWRYGIKNVYRPSIEFARTFVLVNDPWRSPRLEWLAKFTWIFAPAVLIVGAIALVHRLGIRPRRIEVAALTLCAGQYAGQWLEQFARHGHGLDLSYYASFSYPSFAVAIAVVVGRLTANTRDWAIAGIGAAWIGLLLVGVPNALRLPPGVWFALTALVVVVVAVVVAKKSPVLTVAIVIGLIGWTQIGAPHYDASAYFKIDISPRYDELFRKAGDLSENIHNEAIWFANQMDRIGNDASASFVTAGGWSSSITGLYAPHVDGRLVGMSVDGFRLARRSVIEVKSGYRPILAVYGDPQIVKDIVNRFPADLGVGKVLLDATHDSALRYRLVIYAMPDAANFPFTWSADLLPVTNGEVVGTSIVVRSGDSPGFVTFGPYVPLNQGEYKVTIRYTSSSPASEQIGIFDVSSPEEGDFGSATLGGSDGQVADVTLNFAVGRTGSRWEFRSSWLGNGNFEVKSITLSGA